MGNQPRFGGSGKMGWARLTDMYENPSQEINLSKVGKYQSALNTKEVALGTDH